MSCLAVLTSMTLNSQNREFQRFFAIFSCGAQACWEPQRGPGKHSCRASKYFSGPLWGEIFEFFFLKWCILVYFLYFWATAGSPKCCSLPLTPPSRWVWHCTLQGWIALKWLEIDQDNLRTGTAKAVARFARFMSFAQIACSLVFGTKVLCI